jgi:hypothetical protein
METSVNYVTYVPAAVCQLQTAQFIATGDDISVRDLWLIPDIALCA